MLMLTLIQTDRPTDRPTDRQTDRVTYRDTPCLKIIKISPKKFIVRTTGSKLE